MLASVRSRRHDGLGVNAFMQTCNLGGGHNGLTCRITGEARIKVAISNVDKVRRAADRDSTPLSQFGGRLHRVDASPRHHEWRSKRNGMKVVLRKTTISARPQAQLLLSGRDGRTRASPRHAPRTARPTTLKAEINVVGR